MFFRDGVFITMEFIRINMVCLLIAQILARVLVKKFLKVWVLGYCGIDGSLHSMIEVVLESQGCCRQPFPYL